MDYDVATMVKITPQMIQDQIVTAFEGGSNYWLGDGRVELVKPTYDELGGREEKIVWYGRQTANVFALDDYRITVQTEEGEKELTRFTVARGLAQMATEQPDHFLDLMNEDGDATTADVFLQLCLFESVVYG